MRRGSKEVQHCHCSTWNTSKYSTEFRKDPRDFKCSSKDTDFVKVALLLHNFVPRFEYRNQISIRISVLPCHDDRSLAGLYEQLSLHFRTNSFLSNEITQKENAMNFTSWLNLQKILVSWRMLRLIGNRWVVEIARCQGKYKNPLKMIRTVQDIPIDCPMTKKNQMRQWLINLTYITCHVLVRNPYIITFQVIFTCLLKCQRGW